MTFIRPCFCRENSSRRRTWTRTVVFAGKRELNGGTASHPPNVQLKLARAQDNRRARRKSIRQV